MKNFDYKEKKYTDRVEFGNSKKYYLFQFLIAYSNANIREILSNESLTLRKNKHKQELFARRGIYLSDRERHQVCPLKLKGIPDAILEKFRINPGIEDTIKKTMEYLNSQELNEIKFGAFLLRRFFADLVTYDTNLNKENKAVDFKIDLFLENNLIQTIGKVLTVESNLDILSELTWALVNITNFEAEKGGCDYIKQFMNKTYMNIFYKIVNMRDNEIIINLYDFFVNCIIESNDFGKFILDEKEFIKLCVMRYLEQNKPEKLEQEAKKAAIYFFVSLSKLSNNLSEKQKYTFFKIYEKFLGINFESVVLMHILVGIRFLFLFDQSEEKTIFNIIKTNNYDIFDKLMITFNNIYNEDESFSGIDIIIFNIKMIICHFIQLSDEKDTIFLVQNTQLINFISHYFEVLFFKKTQIFLLDILVQLSHHSANVVLNMIQNKENFLNLIKNNLNSNNFEIKMKFVDIVYSMVSLNSLDINIILYKNEIIDFLIKVNLPYEEEKDCLKLILSSILFFINGIKPLQRDMKIQIINDFIKIGISNGIENLTTRFNEEHISIINQINLEMKNILNNEENIQNENGINDNRKEFQNKSLNINVTNNLFLNYNVS